MHSGPATFRPRRARQASSTGRKMSEMLPELHGTSAASDRRCAPIIGSQSVARSAGRHEQTSCRNQQRDARISLDGARAGARGRRRIGGAVRRRGAGAGRRGGGRRGWIHRRAVDQSLLGSSSFGWPPPRFESARQQVEGCGTGRCVRTAKFVDGEHRTTRGAAATAGQRRHHDAGSNSLRYLAERKRSQPCALTGAARSARKQASAASAQISQPPRTAVSEKRSTAAATTNGAEAWTNSAGRAMRPITRP